MIGLLSLSLLVVWGKVSWLQKSPIPGPLVAVLFGTAVNLVLIQMGHPWAIAPTHLVQVPVAEGASGFLQLFSFPDFSALAKPAVYGAAVTLAVIASLETLLTIEAVDKIDPQQRKSPANRELLAQGAGKHGEWFSGWVADDERDCPLGSKFECRSANENLCHLSRRLASRLCGVVAPMAQSDPTLRFSGSSDCDWI